MSNGDKKPAVPPPKKPPVPSPGQANPFLPPRETESARALDAGWLDPDEAAEASLPPPKDDAPASPEPSRPPPKPAPAPPPKRSRAKVIAFVLLPVLVLVGGGFVYRAKENARKEKERAAPPSSAEEPARVEPPVSVAEPPPPPTFTPESPPSASASAKKAAGNAAAPSGPAAEKNADPSKTGIIDTTALPAGRKIIVDGSVVGTSPRRVVIRCGSHRIQIGDLPPEIIALPCGGEVSFTD